MEQVKLLVGGEVPPHVCRNILGMPPPKYLHQKLISEFNLPCDMFQVFFDEAVKYVDEITAADERRQEVAHMSDF